MKILLVHYALPPQSIIGPSVHVYQLAQGLAKHGHAVDVLTLNNNELNGTLTDEYPINNFEVLSIVKNQFHSIFSYILNSASIIKKLESNYDIIHAHTISSSSLLIYKPRTPSVVTVHGVYSEWYNKMKSEIISEKIKVVVLTSQNGIFDKCIIAAAQELNVPVLRLQHGIGECLIPYHPFDKYYKLIFTLIIQEFIK